MEYKKMTVKEAMVIHDAYLDCDYVDYENCEDFSPHHRMWYTPSEIKDLLSGLTEMTRRNNRATHLLRTFYAEHYATSVAYFVVQLIEEGITIENGGKS